jgi:hypothetical protein
MKYKAPKFDKKIEEMTQRPIKPENKDVGACLRYRGKEQIFRSKFRNAEDAQDRFDKYKKLGVVNPEFIVYKCPECKMWHFGKKEWANE